MALRMSGIAAVTMLLAGCAAGPRATPRPAPSVGVVAAARPQQPVRGDAVLGRTAPALVSQFGQPALDVREGQARKLQFSGAACVLDAYLYPPAAGRGEAVVTHVDARLPDGRDTDRNACAAQLRTR